MKIVLEVQNTKKAIKPSKNDIIIYDGQSWYITQKSDLFKEYDDRFKEKLQECDEKLESLDKYQKEIAKQMLDMGEILANILNTKEKK